MLPTYRDHILPFRCYDIYIEMTFRSLKVDSDGEVDDAVGSEDAGCEAQPQLARLNRQDGQGVWERALRFFNFISDVKKLRVFQRPGLGD